jgi:hypothetical protein
MLPPTQIMAAVPTALRIARNTGIPRTRACPSPRPIPTVQRDGTELDFMLMFMVWHDGFEHLLDSFVAEIGATNHEQRRDRLGEEVAKG